MPINLTVGTNTYISAVDAETYFDTRLFADAWTAASADDKAKALIMATKALDRLTLKGRKKDTTQGLEFPRCYSYDTRNLPGDSGFASFPDDGWYCEQEVPQVVCDAACEEALALLASGNDPRRVMQRAGVKSYSLGSLSETFADGAVATASSKRGLISEEARSLMRPYLAGAVFVV